MLEQELKVNLARRVQSQGITATHSVVTRTFARLRQELVDAGAVERVYGRDAQPGALIGRKGFNHHTLVYQYRLCYTMSLYCTGALSHFSYTQCRPITRAGCASLDI